MLRDEWVWVGFQIQKWARTFLSYTQHIRNSENSITKEKCELNPRTDFLSLFSVNVSGKHGLGDQFMGGKKVDSVHSSGAGHRAACGEGPLNSNSFADGAGYDTPWTQEESMQDTEPTLAFKTGLL